MSSVPVSASRKELAGEDHQARGPFRTRGQHNQQQRTRRRVRPSSDRRVEEGLTQHGASRKRSFWQS